MLNGNHNFKLNILNDISSFAQCRGICQAYGYAVFIWNIYTIRRMSLWLSDCGGRGCLGKMPFYGNASYQSGSGSRFHWTSASRELDLSYRTEIFFIDVTTFMRQEIQFIIKPFY